MITRLHALGRIFVGRLCEDPPMPPQRTPVQDAWLTLDTVASALDRTAYRRERLTWERMNLMATRIREAREALMEALGEQPPGGSG